MTRGLGTPPATRAVVPNGTADSARLAARFAHLRFNGVLPHRMLRWRRPVWWQEIAIIVLGYWIYSLGRNAIPKQGSIAGRHGRSIQHLQDVLHLNWELSINHFVAAHAWLAQPFDYYYATFHFIVTPMVMVWLFVRRSSLYRGARTVLVATTMIALAGFYLYPTAPPRLLSGYGYIDTVLRFHTWGSLADPNIAHHSNQFAAMPSLHVGWALWCGIAIFRCARHTWVRVLGLLYPCVTFIVIIGTANHFILDAVAGAAVVLAAFGVQWLLSGHGAYTAPVDAVRPHRRTPPPAPSVPPQRQATKTVPAPHAAADASAAHSESFAYLVSHASREP